MTATFSVKEIVSQLLQFVRLCKLRLNYTRYNHIWKTMIDFQFTTDIQVPTFSVMFLLRFTPVDRAKLIKNII